VLSSLTLVPNFIVAYLAIVLILILIFSFYCFVLGQMKAEVKLFGKKINKKLKNPIYHRGTWK